jgi:hypothetical protein
MRIEFTNTPWFKGEISQEATNASQLIDGIWREATNEYVAIRESRMQQGLREPKGFQSHLNRIIDYRFNDAGWDGEGGRFVNGDTWIRITFRHQMSIGSDFLDALRVVRREGVQFAAICAAPLEILRVISPNDAAALTSFEKLNLLAASLDDVFDIPLVLGALVPQSSITSEVIEKLLSSRPRN